MKASKKNYQLFIAADAAMNTVTLFTAAFDAATNKVEFLDSIYQQALLVDKDENGGKAVESRRVSKKLRQWIDRKNIAIHIKKGMTIKFTKSKGCHMAALDGRATDPAIDPVEDKAIDPAIDPATDPVEDKAIDPVEDKAIDPVEDKVNVRGQFDNIVKTFNRAEIARLSRMLDNYLSAKGK